MQKLHPRAYWLFFLSSSLYFVTMCLCIGIVFLVLFLTELNSGNELLPGTKMLGMIGIPLWFFFFVIGPFIWAKLTYRFYRYELRKDSLQIECGVLRKVYTTIPFERIQNVDIQRGIWSRTLGLSWLIIQTAGLSGAGGSEGALPGLSKEVAEQLRKELIAKSK